MTEKKVKDLREWLEILKYLYDTKQPENIKNGLGDMIEYFTKRIPENDEVIAQMSIPAFRDFQRSATIIKQLREENESLKSKLKFQKFLNRINNFINFIKTK